MAVAISVLLAIIAGSMWALCACSHDFMWEQEDEEDEREENNK